MHYGSKDEGDLIGFSLEQVTTLLTPDLTVTFRTEKKQFE